MFGMPYTLTINAKSINSNRSNIGLSVSFPTDTCTDKSKEARLVMMYKIDNEKVTIHKRKKDLNHL